MVLSFASLQSISKASCSILYIDITFHKQTVKNPFPSQRIDTKLYLNSSKWRVWMVSCWEGELLAHKEGLNGFLSLNGLLLRGRASCSQRKVWMVSWWLGEFEWFLVERGSLNLVSCCYLVRLAKKGSVVGNSIQRLVLASAKHSFIP